MTDNVSAQFATSGHAAEASNGRLDTAARADDAMPPPTDDAIQDDRFGTVTLERLAWLLTVLACLVAAFILVLEGYYGYAGVTFAVAVSAAINIH